MRPNDDDNNSDDGDSDGRWRATVYFVGRRRSVFFAWPVLGFNRCDSASNHSLVHGYGWLLLFVHFSRLLLPLFCRFVWLLWVWCVLCFFAIHISSMCIYDEHVFCLIRSRQQIWLVYIRLWKLQDVFGTFFHRSENSVWFPLSDSSSDVEYQLFVSRTVLNGKFGSFRIVQVKSKVEKRFLCGQNSGVFFSKQWTNGFLWLKQKRHIFSWSGTLFCVHICWWKIRKSFDKIAWITTWSQSDNILDSKRSMRKHVLPVEYTECFVGCLCFAFNELVCCEISVASTLSDVANNQPNCNCSWRLGCSTALMHFM